jgi:hypothetical protein
MFLGVLRIAPLAPRLLSNNWRGPDGAREIGSGLACALYSASADYMVMMLGVP